MSKNSGNSDLDEAFGRMEVGQAAPARAVAQSASPFIPTTMEPFSFAAPRFVPMAAKALNKQTRKNRAANKAAAKKGLKAAAQPASKKARARKPRISEGQRLAAEAGLAPVNANAMGVVVPGRGARGAAAKAAKAAEKAAAEQAAAEEEEFMEEMRRRYEAENQNAEGANAAERARQREENQREEEGEGEIAPGWTVPALAELRPKAYEEYYASLPNVRKITAGPARRLTLEQRLHQLSNANLERAELRLSAYLDKRRAERITSRKKFGRKGGRRTRR
jgi:hypothetical protein